MNKRVFAGIGAGIAWFAIVLQAVLIIQNRVVGIPETVLRFFSFFTILSNIIVAICLTSAAFNRQGFWTKPSTQTAVAVYIAVVGIVYNVVLRQLWAPQGMQRVVDELLHLVNPLLYIAFWFAFVQKQQLAWKTIFPWLIYPLLYLVFILFAGSVTDYYPYPFVDVFKFGYPKVPVNCVFVLLLFVVLSAIFIGLSRLLSNKKQIQLG